MGTITFGRLASQGGKTYIPLEAVVPDGGRVSVSARTTGAHPVPSKLLHPWGHEGWVIVVPSLLATIRLSVLVCDGEGFPVEHELLMVRPSTAFLASTFNRMRNGEELLWYLGLDDRPCGDATSVELERLYTDFETTDVLHGTIEFPGSDPEALGRPFEALLIDVFGRPIDGPRLVANRDDIQRQPDGSYLRSVRFSQTISRQVRSFTLWVRHPDHRVPDGFLCLDAPTLTYHREMDAGRRFARPDGLGYHDWYVHNGQSSGLELARLREASPGEPTRVSLLVDLDPLDPLGLEETLQSLRDQTHGAWELIGYGNVGPDGRHRWRGPAWGEEPAGPEDLPPATPAEALGRARGEAVGLVDGGDTLEPDTLQRLCDALAGSGEGPGAPATMAYADQDLRALGDEGHGYYLEGFIKTQFDRDLLYATGATGRPALVRRECLDEGALAARDARGLALDLELALAAVEAGGAIAHVPRVLYHRLAREGLWVGTETAPWANTDESRACEAVLQAHLDRLGISATVGPNEVAAYGRIVDYRAAEPPLVSIVIPNKDSVPVLRRCLESIAAQSTYGNYEVVVVENNSEEPETFAYYETLASDPRVRVVGYEGPFNFSAICNRGAREAEGSYLLFLNNDTEVLEPRWIEAMLGPLLRGDVGAVGAHLLYPDELLQHGGVLIQAEGPLHLELFVPPGYNAYQGLTRFHSHQASAVTGACVLVPRSVFNEVGGFDESLPIAYNDVQLCISIREAGYGVAFEPRARLRHYESYSRGLDYDDRRKVVRLVSEIGETMLRWTRLYAEGDPFYDHRYAYHNNYFTLGWSPSLHAVED